MGDHGDQEAPRSEHAYDQIKRRIIQGRYRPGAHLSETALARHGGTSRTPVREALSRLMKEGYVEHRERRGFFVTVVTVALVRDTYQVRRLVEGWGAARAASLGSADEITRMRQLANHSYDTSLADAYQRALDENLEFHLAVAGASHNRLLVELIRDCLTRTNWMLSLGMEYTPFHEHTTEEHHGIVDAIERRDGPVARQRMQAHLDRTRRLMVKSFGRSGVAGSLAV